MIFLESASRIIYETVYALIYESFEEQKKKGLLNINGGDFDGTKIYMKTHEDKVEISVSVYGENVFSKYGGVDKVKEMVKGVDVQEPGQEIENIKYSFTVTVPLDKLREQKDYFLERLPKLKVYYMSGVFIYAMTEHSKGNTFDTIRIPYRPEENIYLIPYKGKSLVVVFSILFRDPDDVVLAQGFLSEFKDAKKDRTLGSAPSLWFSQGQLPGELSGLKDVTEPKDEKTLTQEGWGFISLGLLDHQLKQDKQMNSCELIISFRSYLHYHLKCMKAYMHIRMRDRIEKLMQSLNAAKDMSGKVTEKKTIHGKTFQQK